MSPIAFFIAQLLMPNSERVNFKIWVPRIIKHYLGGAKKLIEGSTKESTNFARRNDKILHIMKTTYRHSGC